MDVPIVKIDNPKHKQRYRNGMDLSDHYPIFFFVRDLKIISYNIQFMPLFISTTEGKSTKKDIKKTINQIVQYFVTQDADICCVQELFDNFANECIEERMLYHGYMATARVGSTILSLFNGGVRTFIKKNLVAHEFNTYEYVYQNKIDYFIGADALVNKGITHSSFRNAQGTKYHILNTHLQAYYEHRDHYAEVTLAQVVELKRYIERQQAGGIIKKGDEIILCGDFNIPKSNNNAPPSFLYEKMIQIMGPQFTFLNHARAPGKPIHTLSQHNTYNQSKPITADMNISVDMALIFNPSPYGIPTLVHQELADIYCDIQLAISNYICKNATLYTQWLISPEKQKELAQFNLRLKTLMMYANTLLCRNINPLDNKKWFTTALHLSCGPQKCFSKESLCKPQHGTELKELNILPLENIPIKDLKQFKEQFNKALYNLRQLHAEIHKNYTNSPNKHKKNFELSLMLKHVLFNAWGKFIKHPTSASFSLFKSTFVSALDKAINEFDKDTSIWAKAHLILTGIINLILNIMIYPKPLITKNSIHHYALNFFFLPEFKKLTEMKQSFNLSIQPNE